MNKTIKKTVKTLAVAALFMSIFGAIFLRGKMI